MCITLPAKVLSVKGKNAVVDIIGKKTKVAADFSGKLRAGDYVIVSGGHAIERLSRKEAKESLRLWDELTKAA
jgi:hydrogenase expression/formation protein HypC